MASVEEGGKDDDCEDEDLEREQEEVEEEQEAEEEDQEEGEGEEDDTITAEELKEAWAAGWRAKDQVAEKRKGRNFLCIAKDLDVKITRPMTSRSSQRIMQRTQ